MAAYKGIQGYSVQNLSSDPTASEAEGQLWYNSTAGKFKIAVAGAGAWASGTAMSTTRQEAATAQTAPTSAGQVAGGGGPGSLNDNTEQYNGSAWTEVADLNTAKFGQAGTGTQTAALSAGGFTTTWVAETEEWSGTSWAASNNMSSAARFEMASAGTQTAALISGGEGTPGSTPRAFTEKYDGTSWSEVNDLNQARYGLIGGGTQTAALAIGGNIGGPGAPSALVEEYDGTSWTTLPASLNTARGYAGAAVTTTENAIFFAGSTNPGTALKANTESFNGTTWTEVGDIGTARTFVNGSGTSTSALCSGGGPGTGGGTATEEWSDPVYANKTVTVS